VPEPAVPASGERRQVTILFADIAGFTELSSLLDAEELHGLVSQFFAAADGAIENYGGTVDKHMGDAVMALFGAPVAHGDDPLRAVRAAFDIHGAMEALSAELGRELRVHVGIASGEVVAGGLGSAQSQEYTVLGDSVNLASRLDGLAEAGQTLIAEAVQRAVLHDVDCESLGEVAVKGLDKPVRVWRARGLADAAPAGARGRLVGRKSELRQFAGVLEACREAGAGQTVVLRGEAGIGKTRLVEEFAALALAQGFSAHKSLVLDFGVGKGQDAIRLLVQSLLGLQGGGPEAARAQAA
jgi:class 3 adenylate cyclase